MDHQVEIEPEVWHIEKETVHDGIKISKLNEEQGDNINPFRDTLLHG